MIDGTMLGSRRASNILLPLMAVASFLLYALGVLTLHQDRAHGWALEAAGAVPVAVSYLVYGTPLGATDDNVLQSFLQPDGKSVQDVLATAAAGSIPHGPVDMYSMDGSGAGTDLFATAAMWLFGISMSSLARFYLVLIGISVVAFVLRYQDKRLFVVLLYFFVLTVMLLTPLCTSAAAATHVPIGGQRYFALAPFLPVLHIYFEFIERSDTPERKRRIANSLLLLVQAVLLFGALLVRSSTGYLLGALLGVLIWRFYEERKQRVEMIVLLRNAAIVAAAFAFCAVIVAAALPAYLQTGRLFGNFWHRAFATFSADPDWPYGDLRAVYDCTKFIPEGLNNQNDDRNGHCIWWIYPPNAKRPANEISNGIYGREYETAVRNAYFYVLIHYPKQVFRLYFYVKSLLIGRRALAGLELSVRDRPRPGCRRPVCDRGGATLAVHLVYRFDCGSRPDGRRPPADHLSGGFYSFACPALCGCGNVCDDRRHGLSDVCMSGFGHFACHAAPGKNFGVCNDENTDLKCRASRHKPVIRLADGPSAFSVCDR